MWGINKQVFLQIAAFSLQITRSGRPVRQKESALSEHNLQSQLENSPKKIRALIG